MTKTTRADFIREVTKSGYISYIYIDINDLPDNKLIKLIDKIDVKKLEFNQVHFQSNALIRRLEKNNSYLYFKKGDVIKKYVRDDVIFYRYNDCILYVIK